MSSSHQSQRSIETLSYGAELEKPFSHHSGLPHAVGNKYFETIHALSADRGESPEFIKLDEAIVGVVTANGVEGLDNSFGLGESSVWPAVFHEEGGLDPLNEVLQQQISDTVEALGVEGATITNMANHPLTMVDDETYKRLVVPKPVYGFMCGVRGWDHKAGINAKAQNSPSVGVNVEHAVGALNCSMAIGAAIFALFGNSPFDQGKLTAQKESRQVLWEAMFRNNVWPGDRRTIHPPERPFRNLRDYFEWMFAADTSMYFVVVEKDGPAKSEKGDVSFLQIKGDPTALEFLKKDRWEATEYPAGTSHTVLPEMHHFEAMQFTQFSGARIRYKLKEAAKVEEFNAAMAGHGNEVEEYFEENAQYIYIEERDPGANFPDRELNDIDETVAQSVVIAPAAIYTGIIRNLAAAKQLVNKYGWENLRQLRNEAIIDGLDATYGEVKVRDVCEDLLEVAAHGLQDNEAWMLAYPELVLRSGQNGADRAIAQFELLNGDAAARIQQIVRDRAIVLPNQR